MIGKAGAYGTDRPLEQNYIGEALKNTEDNAFKYRQEQRLADEKKKAEQEDIDKENATVLGYLKNPTTTKFSTQNALTIDGATKLFNGVAEKAQQLKNGKISKLDYDIYKANAMGQMDLMNQANKRINTQGEDYAKQLADGKISPVFADNALNFGKAFQDNNIHFELQPDGRLKAFAYDDPKNPTKIIEKGDLSTFGNYSFTPIANYDIDKDITEFKKTYPPVLTEKLGYNTKTGVKGLTPQIEKAIDLKVNSLIADKNSLAVANAQRPGGVVNPTVEDPKDIEATKKFLKERYLNAYSPETTIDEATQRTSEARQGRAKEKEIETPVVVTANNVDLTEDIIKTDKGGKIIIDRKGIKPQAVTFEKGIPIENIGGEKTKLNNLNIKSILINHKNQILFTGTVLDTKGSTQKDYADPSSERTGATFKRVTRVASGEIEGAIASKMGFSSPQELKNYMNGIQPKETPQHQETLAEKMRRLAGKK